MNYLKNRSGLLTRRDTLRGAGALGLGTALSGLAAPALRAQSSRPIRFLNCETAKDTLAFFGKMAEDYKAKTGTEVIVDSVPLDEAFTKITNAVRAGTPYDVANVGFIGQVLMMAEQDLIVPLNELTDPYKWGNNILFPVDGKVWWYPFDYNLAVIYYRKDLYDEKSLKVPDTWDQFVANSEALSEGRRKGALFPIGSNGAANWMSFAFLWAEGVKLFDDQWNVILDNDEMKAKAAGYLDFMAKLYPTMPPGALQAGYAEVLGGLVSGTLAHGPYAGRVFEAAARDNPEMGDNFGLMPYMDSAGKHKAVSHGYDGWVVMKTDNTGPAMEFMRWLTTEKIYDFLHSAPVHFQPARLDLYEDERWLNNPLIQKYSGAIEQMRGWITDDSITLTSIDTQGPAPDVRPGKAFESFAMPEMLQNKLLKGMDSAEAVQLAADKIRDAIK